MVFLARKNRKNMSPIEAVMWSRLKGNALGVRFRRQEPIGHYIVDFVCIPLRLVVEIDGASHAYEAEYDAKRTAYLVSKGFRVIRFTNEEAWKHRDGVIESIAEVIKEQQRFVS